MKTMKILTVLMLMAVLVSCQKEYINPTTTVTNIKNNSSVVSNLLEVDPGFWGYVGGKWVCTISDSIITNDTKDGVELFVGLDTNSFYALPGENILSNSDYLGYSYGNGLIELDYNYATQPTKVLYFKLVVISPEMRKKYPEINWANYSQIKSIL